MDIEYDVYALEKYFKIYNEQIKQVKWISGECQIDISNGLESIVNSINYFIDVGPYFIKQGCLSNTYTYIYRNEFCRQVVLYWINTGNVPDFNVKEIVESSKNDLPFYLGKSFEKFSRMLESLIDRIYVRELN